MCYAIPGQVMAIDGRYLTIRYFEETRRVINELPGMTVGEFVLAQGGHVISRVKPAEALATLETWRDLFHVLQERDAGMAVLDTPPPTPDALQKILDDALAGTAPDRATMRRLLALDDPGELGRLYKTANAIRNRHHRNSCCVHGILEISSHCRSFCEYCGLAADVPQPHRYRMSREEILAAVNEAVEIHGFRSLVLQSGEDPHYTVDELAGIIREIRARHGVLVCVSFGEIGLDGLGRLFDAGARGLLMRFETSNPVLYAKLRKNRTFDQRLAHLRRAVELGYLVMTGGLIGLPGQTLDDQVNDILLAAELRAEMFSFGPLLPSGNHHLDGVKLPSEEQVLRTLAVARCVAPPDAKVLVTTAFETLSPTAREKGLMAGANSVMLNVTPLRYRPAYAIYAGRAHAEETITSQIRGAVALLQRLGRAPTDLGAREA